MSASWRADRILEMVFGGPRWILPMGVRGAIQVLPIGYLRLRPARFEERWAGERGDFCFFFLKER